MRFILYPFHSIKYFVPNLVEIDQVAFEEKNPKFLSMYFRYLKSGRGPSFEQMYPRIDLIWTYFIVRKQRVLKLKLRTPSPIQSWMKISFMLQLICRIKGKKNWYITNLIIQNYTVNVVHMKTHKNNWSKTTRFLNKQLMCLKIESGAVGLEKKTKMWKFDDDIATCYAMWFCLFVCLGIFVPLENCTMLGSKGRCSWNW